MNSEFLKFAIETINSMTDEELEQGLREAGFYVVRRANSSKTQSAPVSAPEAGEGAWTWAQRAKAAEAFLRSYADASMEKLLGGYDVQPIVRRLAAAIQEWQQGAARPTAANAVVLPYGCTPLPWRITEPGERKGPREIIGANGSTVAKLTALDMANAELIVASVNRTPAEKAGDLSADELHDFIVQNRDSAMPMFEYRTAVKAMLSKLPRPAAADAPRLPDEFKLLTKGELFALQKRLIDSGTYDYERFGAEVERMTLERAGYYRRAAVGAEVLSARHPVQPLVTDEHGRVRFKRNAIVDHLANGKLNDLAAMDFPQEDWEQLAQLIGYSLSGFGTLSYVTDETYDRAAAQADRAAAVGAPVLDQVEGDLLPPVGSKVLIHLARQDAWVEHTVAGYYARGDLGGDDSLHRVFVRVVDAEGFSNSRLLKDVRPSAKGAPRQKGGAA